ncbi:MAG TPA: DUF4097 family beta strand repeat-containing protein [Bacteroidales bacterium]|nr:DUF4097 family beta strand repeat-containing protein [Bacteroidales bacterium]
MKYRNLIILAIYLLLPGIVNAQKSNSETRNFIKSFAASREVTLDLKNKYGNINISSWDRDSVTIRAEVKAFASGRDKLEKMFEGVSVNISGSQLTIRAETEFSQSFSMIIESFKGMTGKMIPYDSRLEINYYIQAPEYINLRLENRYGDVFIENLTGSFTASISNGAFKAGSLGKSTNLNLSFCDAIISKIASGSLESSLSEISIDETTDLTIESISSRLDFKKAGDLRIESRRDKFYIDELNSLYGNSYFTDFRINDLSKEIRINSKYGNLDVNPIRREFKSVDITSSYSDISISFEPGTSYNLEIRHLNTFLVLPEDDIKTERRVLNEEKKEYMIYGAKGKNPGSSVLKIDATRGNVYVK